MLNWLKSIGGYIFGGIKDVWHAFLHVINVTYRLVEQDIHWVYEFALSYAKYAINLADTIAHDLWGAITNLGNWIKSLIGGVTRWVLSLYHDLLKFAQGVYNWTVKAVDYLGHYIDLGIRNLANWVMLNIWDPLNSKLDWIRNFTTKYISQVLNYITHPQLLAGLLIGYLFKYWLKLLAKYAKPIVAYMLSHWKGVISPVVKIAEDIISSLL